MMVIVALSLACAAAHRFGRGASWGDPGLLHAGVWLVASGSHLAFAGDLVPAPTAMLVVVSAGVIAFSAGVWIGSRSTLLSPPVEWKLPTLAVAALTAIVAAGSVALFLRARQLVPADTLAPWFWALRHAVNDSGSSFGPAAYLANAGFAAAFMAVLLARGRAGVALAVLAAVLAFANAVLLTGRTFLLLVGVLLGVALAHRPLPGASRLRALAALVVAMLAVGVAVTVLQARSATDMGGLIAAIRYEWIHYVPSGLAAFGVEVAAGAPLEGGLRTFRTPLAVLKALGVDATVVPLVRPFVHVPFGTNVYTAFSPYHADFGIVGVLAVFALLGLLTGHVAVRARGRRPVVLLLHAVLLYALIMQFFQDQYASLLSQWIQLLVLGALFALPARRGP